MSMSTVFVAPAAEGPNREEIECAAEGSSRPPPRDRSSSSWTFAADGEPVDFQFGKALTAVDKGFGLDAAEKQGWKAVNGDGEPLDKNTTSVKGCGFLVPGEGEKLVTASTLLKKIKGSNPEGAFKELKDATAKVNQASPKTGNKKRARDESSDE